MKGQVRKAKTKAAAANNTANNSEPVQLLTNGLTLTNNCTHNNDSMNTLPDVVKGFVLSFVNSFLDIPGGDNEAVISAAINEMRKAKKTFPEALSNEKNRERTKKAIIATGVEDFFRNTGSSLSFGCAVAVISIDDMADERDANAKDYLANFDVMNGCYRSLVKFFMKRAPCKCLDGMYSKLKLLTPKMSDCVGCNQRKKRTELYICTGCERVVYCSAAKRVKLQMYLSIKTCARDFRCMTVSRIKHRSVFMYNRILYGGENSIW